MKEEELKSFIVLVVIGLMWLSAVITILIIKANRFLFWIDVFFLIASIPVIVFLLYLAFTKETYSYSFGPKSFEGWIELGVSILVLLLFLFAIFNLDNHYDQGYSDEALKILIQKTQEKEDLELIFNTISSKGKNLEQFTIDETINALCGSTLISCNQKQEYSKKLINLKGHKNSADFIAELLWVR